MRNKGYFVRLKSGSLIKDRGVAIPYRTKAEASRVAKKRGGEIGFWNWAEGRFEPLAKKNPSRKYRVRRSKKRYAMKKKTRRNCGCGIKKRSRR